MDDGKRKNLELIRSITVLVGLFLLAAPANGSPKKVRETPVAEKLGADKDPVVVAQSAALIDSFTGEFLFLKNENAIQYPASSTKILTALLVIEAGDLGEISRELTFGSNVPPLRRAPAPKLPRARR